LPLEASKEAVTPVEEYELMALTTEASVSVLEKVPTETPLIVKLDDVNGDAAL
jgi:hypothetical protein